MHVAGSRSEPGAPETAAPQSAVPPETAGLTSEQAHALLAQYGPNRLVPVTHRPALLVWLLRPLADPMAVLLLIAGLTYATLQEYLDAAVTLIALLPIVLVTLVLEWRAEQALEHLRRLAAPAAAVWRDGRRQVIPAESLVPGDILFVQEGDLLPADAELLAGAPLMVDESALTGESLPVAKDPQAGADARLLFAGTTVLSGRGVARVTATGAHTRYGQISQLVAEIKQPPTPLERLVRRLVRGLGVAALALCVAAGALELMRGRGWAAAVIAGVSLGIAAIPEEFPMVFTLYLTLGAWRLARSNALIRRLAGVETLGSTTVICTDKTGTLTLGRMEVAGLFVPAAIECPRSMPSATCPEGGRAGQVAPGVSEAERALLEAAVLASEPQPFDPVDQAIYRYAAARGIDTARLHSGRLVHDYPFDPARKYLSHVWEHAGVAGIYAKGALESIIELAGTPPNVQEEALAANRTMAARGWRVIAVAAGRLPDRVDGRAAAEQHLSFLGLIAFADPVRPGVAEALRECHTAGIRVIMVTGDHPLTAHAVAHQLGLPHTEMPAFVTGAELDAAGNDALARLATTVNIFARTRPEHKYHLVRVLRAQGAVVAMTGDGINDAPALREADIGVAMGQRGTEVARAAATLVLLDDNFATIVKAVRDGRRIFDNLQRAFTYLIAFHTPLLLAALLVPLIGAPLLLLPVHLVWLELIVHPTASLVFEYDPPAPDLMRRPPRPRGAGLLSWQSALRATAVGTTLCAGALALYLVRLGQSVPEPLARGVALAALILGQTITVLGTRSPDRPLWQTGLRGNHVLPWIVGATLASLLVALYVPPVAVLVKLAPPSPGELAVAAAVALLTTIWPEFAKFRARPASATRAA
jgi:Ca2+-transporting ATPase